MTSMSLNNALDILTINIPVQYKRRSSRKMIMTPSGLPISQEEQKNLKPDNSFVTAIMRAFSWQEKLENGTYSSHKEMAEKEKMDITYMYRTMRLVLLAPDIIENTLIACERLGRQCRTSELDPKYVDVIVKRWEGITKKKARHAETGQVFDENINSVDK